VVSEPRTIDSEIRSRAITRLCHLTPSRNLIHIVAEGQGILSTAQLEDDKRAVFTPQDPHRFDRHRDHISCTIEYPNAWYLEHKRNPVGEAANFRDWAMLGIKPHHLTRASTRFCPENAAGGHGESLKDGIEGFAAMYEPEVINSKGRSFKRTAARRLAVPTNDQAEAMIHRLIPLEDITTIFIPDTAQAARHYFGLEQVGADPGLFRYVIAPTFFEAKKLSAEIRDGDIPTEIEWHPPD